MAPAPAIIGSTRPPINPTAMSEPKSIWVLLEHVAGKVKPASLEVLHAAASLAQKTGGAVTAWYMGEGEAPQGLPGADHVAVINGPGLNLVNTAGAIAALLPQIETKKPFVIMVSATNHGKELAAGLAARLGIGLATDCVAIQYNDADGLRVQRPVFAGKAVSTVTFIGDHTRILTLRPNVFRSDQVVDEKSPDITVVESGVSWESLPLVISSVVKESGARVDVTEGRIIVSGGMGMGGPENFKLIEDLAEVLGAAVGASRPVVDNGWRPYSNQVGQTGRTVSPDLYIACGISGAVQHLAGMSSARCIVAINTDANAPIFDVADYGIVGDVLEILPILTAECKKVLQK